MFKAYPKIHRIDKAENEGLLLGEVTLQEKVDGANTSIWMEDGVVKCGSRRRLLETGFRGFVDYVKNHKGINALLKTEPGLRLYGEWLVRHTISYNETAYKQFYMFDILFEDKFISQDEVQILADYHNIKYPQIFFKGKTTLEEIMEFVGKTNIGELGEGVVIKNPEFINQFGEMTYGKIVTQKFKENNAITFGGNNKHSDTYWEMYVVNKYATLARVQKIMHKLETIIDEKLGKQHTPRVIGTCYHDMITEEIWEISRKVVALNFRQLTRLANKKFVQIYHDILDNNLSVADA